MVQKIKTGRWLIGGGALIVVLGAWYFINNENNGPRRPRIAAAPVRVASAERRDMLVVEHTIGTVIPNATVQARLRRFRAASFPPISRKARSSKRATFYSRLIPVPFRRHSTKSGGSLRKTRRH